MSSFDIAAAVLAMVSTVVGATWVLHNVLSEIRSALAVHVAEDRIVHSTHEARIIKLEGTRRGRR